MKRGPLRTGFLKENEGKLRRAAGAAEGKMARRRRAQRKKWKIARRRRAQRKMKKMRAAGARRRRQGWR